MCYLNLTGYYERNGKVRLCGRCVAGKLFSLVVSREGAHSYFENCALAQEAFPELFKEEREFLISGVSPGGWKQIFKEESRAADVSVARPAGLKQLSGSIVDIPR